MSDPFDGANFFIGLAKEHADNFNALELEFLESEPYTMWSDFDSDTGLHHTRVKIVREVPKRLRGYASDAVKNIRDSLDQAMSAAVFGVTGKRKRHAHFPFGESEADLENSLWTEADKSAVPRSRKTRNCRDIPEELFDAIRFIKPYPHEGDQWWLKTLQKVSGPHKHGVALTLGSALAVPAAQLELMETVGGPPTVSTQFHEWDATETEFVVATTKGLPPGGKLILSHPFHIAFDHPELKPFHAGTLIARWGTRTEWIIAGLKKTVEMLVAERGG